MFLHIYIYAMFLHIYFMIRRPRKIRSSQRVDLQERSDTIGTIRMNDKHI